MARISLFIKELIYFVAAICAVLAYFGYTYSPVDRSCLILVFMVVGVLTVIFYKVARYRINVVRDELHRVSTAKSELHKRMLGSKHIPSGYDPNDHS